MLTQATLLLPLLVGMNLISPFGCDLASWCPFSSLPLWRIKEILFNGTMLGSRLASCRSWLAVCLVTQEACRWFCQRSTADVI